MDILPTLCKLAGVELPADLVLDGHPMDNVLLGKRHDEDHPVFFYRGNLLYAVRWNQYKVRNIENLRT